MGNFIAFYLVTLVINVVYIYKYFIPQRIRLKETVLLQYRTLLFLVFIGPVAWLMFYFLRDKKKSPIPNLQPYARVKPNNKNFLMASLRSDVCHRVQGVHERIMMTFARRLSWDTPIVVSYTDYIYRDSADKENKRYKLKSAILNGFETSEDIDELFFRRLCTAVSNGSSVVLKFERLPDRLVPYQEFTLH